MPGISNKFALRDAIIDSLAFGDITKHRLGSRGLWDIDSAIRLRKVEKNLLKMWSPEKYYDLMNAAQDAIRNKYTGNHYVYSFGRFIARLMKNKSFLYNSRSKTVDHSLNLVGPLLEVKMPEYELYQASISLPEGYNRVHRLYAALRSLYDNFLSIQSSISSVRSKLQNINTRNKQESSFRKVIMQWTKDKSEELEKSGQSDPFSSSFTVNEVGKFEITKISDIIFIVIRTDSEIVNVLLTANHLERCMNLLKQISNVILGSLLSYGMDGMISFEPVLDELILYIHSLFKLGEKDDLAVGEAGKAVTDLYKAHLSQTSELPWNNYQMLLRTYSETRQENAMNLWDQFHNPILDPDIQLNLSYVWKLSMQPDSDIRADFIELTEGLSSPNPVKADAPELIEYAIRRAVLVGAVREGRQVQITEAEGTTVHPRVKYITSRTAVSEKDLKMVTYGMMANIKISVNGVFPNPRNVSHLTFKDKSSSLESIKMRKVIQSRSELEISDLSLEDREIYAAAELDAEQFFVRLGALKSEEDTDWAMKATVNDILSSLDEDINEVYRLAEEKFSYITKSLESIREKEGGPQYPELLKEWCSSNHNYLINAATEPKYGEVHKRSVRIFFMFEKGMKTFLSQFERVARVVGHYIKGAEIVKGDRAREEHMNILSSAYRATADGILAYQILFDLSKFSQKFNHKIIDAASKVIGELVDYPLYDHISDLFKASFLYVSARHVDHEFVGVLGAFEGFLNFLWTNIHATVMDIALKDCGRAGDLAAYSDDGLLMFTMSAKPTDSKEIIGKELKFITSSITKTYLDFGLDFNLGKTLISRTLAEFLGVVHYKGHRLPTWMKELCKLGIADENRIVRSLGQEITDISSQMSALIKAGMPPYAASHLGYSEILLGPGRRLINMATTSCSNKHVSKIPNLRDVAVLTFLSLNSSFGGVRVPDPLSTMMTADFDPIAEMLEDIRVIVEKYEFASYLPEYIRDMVKPTDDYTSLLLGSYPINTSGSIYSTSAIRGMIVKKLSGRLNLPDAHPLNRQANESLHRALEHMDSLYMPTITSLMRYAVPVIQYNKLMAPSKSSSIAKLLKKNDIRRIQASDTKAAQGQIDLIVKALSQGSFEKMPSTVELYKKSYPRLKFSTTIPSMRSLVKVSTKMTPVAYEIVTRRLPRLDNTGTFRLRNQAYRDDLVPPLITTDVSVQYLMNAPDLVTHCMRGLYSELVSASAQGHDLTIIANEICRLNKTAVVTPKMTVPLRDMRKVAVANRKKHIHRVFWSEPTKSAITLTRLGPLNFIINKSSNIHCSLLVTATLATTHLLFTCSPFASNQKVFYIAVNSSLATGTALVPMTVSPEYKIIEKYGYNPKDDSVDRAAREAIANETLRQIESTKQELVDNLIAGRMGMIPDFKALTDSPSMVDPLRYAMVWCLVSKLDSVNSHMAGTAGVTTTRISSAALENVPMELVNYAMIYRSYKHAPKSEVAKISKAVAQQTMTGEYPTIKPILREEIALETLYAAEALGLIHSLSVENLQSCESVLIYESMNLADTIHMIYYSLDTVAETDKTPKISPARAKAMGRIIDSVIKNYFIIADYDLSSDLVKLILMLIRGAIRGSVHRDRPYNSNVLNSWASHFQIIINNFYYSRDPSLLRVRKQISQNYAQYQGLNKQELHELREQFMQTEFSSMPVDKGDVDQFAQFYKFLIKMAEWGFLQNLLGTVIRDAVRSRSNQVFDRWIRPAIIMARTVAYSTVEKVLEGLKVPARVTKEMENSLADSVNNMVGMDVNELRMSDLIYQVPQTDYRREPGPLSHLLLEIEFAESNPIYFGASLAFSYAMPLLLASGRSDIESISLLGPLDYFFQSENIPSQLLSYCLPKADSNERTPIGIGVGLSEQDLVFMIRSWILERGLDSLVTIEIPPNATSVSLGLIRFLTAQKYSYVTVGLSSDKEGVSIYVSSIIQSDFPEKFDDIEEIPQVRESLGDSALSVYLEELKGGHNDLLSSLFLSPMHQSGIPVSGYLLKNGRREHLRVEEELIDRNRISFVESGRATRSTSLLASMSARTAAYIIKALLARTSRGDTMDKILLSGFFYIKSFHHNLNDEVLMDFLMSLISDRADSMDQIYAASNIVGAVLTIPRISVCNLPSGAQLLAEKLPLPPDLDMTYDRNIDPLLTPWLNDNPKDVLIDEAKGLLLEYISKHLDNLNPDECWEILKKARPAKTEKKRTRFTLEQKSIAEVPNALEDVARASTYKEIKLDKESYSPKETKALFTNLFDASLQVAPAVVDQKTHFETLYDDIKEQLLMHGFQQSDIYLLDSADRDILEALCESGIRDVIEMLEELMDERTAAQASQFGVL